MTDETSSSEHQLFTDTRFETLGLAPAILQGVRDAGFERCTPIQAESLPFALKGDDVAGQAQTGTGKTAAFLLAVMQFLVTRAPASNYEEGRPRAVILAPTRELAVQIHKDGELLGRHTGLRFGLVFGGTGYEEQREMLRAGVDVLVATPGRLIDYVKQRVVLLDSVQVVVLDEADRMFDLGFIKDIRYILRRMPTATERLNMLFSATLSWRVMELAYEHMNDPQTIDTTDDKMTVDKVEQVLYHVASDEKIALLIGLLRHIDPVRTILFTNTKREAERVAAYLKSNGFVAGMLSGDVPQKQRLKLLEQFSAGEIAILVATDVAARGLHVPDVSHVINYDLPQDAQDYVHRVGRTARVGAGGDAVSFACERYVFSLAEIERYIGRKLPVARVSEELLAEVRPPDYAAFQQRRRRDGVPAKREGNGSGRRARRTNAAAGAGQPAENAAAADTGNRKPASTGLRRRRRRRRAARPQAAE